jgi:hypothetical protein
MEVMIINKSLALMPNYNQQLQSSTIQSPNFKPKNVNSQNLE